MAASPPRARRRLPAAHIVFPLLLAMSAVLPRGAGAVERGLKLPFSPGDVLPVLPRQVAWPVMNTLHRAVDLLPSFVTAVARGAGARGLERRVLRGERGLYRNGTDVGGAVLRLKVKKEILEKLRLDSSPGN